MADVEEAERARRAARHRALGDVHRLAIVDALRHTDLAPSELSEATGLASNLVAFHLNTLEDAGVVVRTASQGDGRRRYVRLVPGLPVEPSGRALTAERVLFVCTRNASRSQLGAALWTARTGRPASSVGREPASAVDPLTVAVAREHGLDLSGAVPHGYDAVTETPDLVITVCDRAGEAQLPVRGVPRLHWSVPDPVGGSRADVEAAHRDLELRIHALVAGGGVAA